MRAKEYKNGKRAGAAAVVLRYGIIYIYKLYAAPATSLVAQNKIKQTPIKRKKDVRSKNPFPDC